MILPPATDPADLNNFDLLTSSVVRKACTRAMTTINNSRPQDSVIQFDYAGMTLTHTVFRKWRERFDGGIAASMWTTEWQVLWDTTGVWVGGDRDAFARDVFYLMLDDLDFDFSSLLVVGVSQKGADRLLAVG